MRSAILGKLIVHQARADITTAVPDEREGDEDEEMTVDIHSP